MRVLQLGWIALTATLLVPIAAAGQQPAISIDDDDIKITGCVAPAGPHASAVPEILVWTRGDLMLAGAATAAGAHRNTNRGMADRVFYWLDHGDDLSKYQGQRVEVEGDLDDFEKGKIEIDRDGEFTKIKLELDGREELVRVPTAWLGAEVRDNAEIKIVARRIDVESVKVLGPCAR